MPMKQDVQTVEADGRRRHPLPDGTVVRDLVTHVDERGSVCELYDPRWGAHPDPLIFAYTFTIRPGHAKGWGLHKQHDDRYAFLAGELELVFYDARDPGDSATAGQESRIVLSGHHRRLVTIPAGVWHAERNLGSSDVVVVNFPTIPYDHTAPDKYRLPLDTDELPVELGPAWVGW
jgi:dTDP-4-dehydrorhamnose 3,5-epimerase